MFWFGVLFTGSPQQRRRYQKSCKLTYEGTAFSFIEHHYTINAVHPKKIQKKTLPDWVYHNFSGSIRFSILLEGQFITSIDG